MIKVRAEAMQKASEALPSGLMTVFLNRQSKLNTAMLAARKWCKEKLKLDCQIECEIANYLNAQCKVIGGNNEALDFIQLNQKEFNLLKVKRLAVSGAFHTSLMKSAEADLKNILNGVTIKKPLVRFYSNFDSKCVYSPEKIKFNLIKQIANPVKWEQTLNEFYYSENLPIDSTNSTNSDAGIDKIVNDDTKKKLQLEDRVYPDIYECGPGSHTGPILKTLNYKAYRHYKYIGV